MAPETCMRRSIAVLENSFSVVPGVTTMALLASRTQRGSGFLCCGGFPAGEEGETGRGGDKETGAFSDPGVLATGGASGVALAPRVVFAVSAPGGSESEEPKGLDGGNGSE